MPDESVTWDLTYPKASSVGLHFARGRTAPTDVLLVHAAPEVLTVELRDARGSVIARGVDLPQTLQSPICRLRRNGEQIEREDIWPSDADLGLIVLLPGGEAGVLKAWWHAPDRKEWRWQLELSNSIR